MKLTTEAKSWSQQPSIRLPSPVFALTAGPHGIWAGGVGGVAWYPGKKRAEEKGQTEWQPRIASLPLTSITALVHYDGLLLAGGLEGIARSRDGGESWQLADLEDGTASITALALSPNFARDQTAVASTLANGILRTTDGGRTWINASFGIDSQEVNTVIWGSDTTILALCPDGIYRSPNAGRAWKHVYEHDDIGSDAIVYNPDGLFIAALEDGGLLRSQDGGAHWTIDHTLQDVQIISLFATSKNTLLLGTVEQGLLHSSDGGKQWHNVYNNAVLSYTEASYSTSNNTTIDAIYIGTDQGVSVSYNDGQTWESLPEPPLHDLRYLHIHKDELLIMGPSTGILRYHHEQQTYSLLPSPEQPPLTTLATAPDGSLWRSSPAGLEHSTDDGWTWQTAVENLDGHVAYLTFRPVGSTWYGWAGSADGSRLLHSNDGGKNWQPLAAPFGVLPLAALQALPKGVIAGTYDSRQFRVKIWYSPDDGKTWSGRAEAETRWPLVATCATPPLASIGNIIIKQDTPELWHKTNIDRTSGLLRRIVSTDQDTLLAFTTNGLLSSTDQGETWKHEQLDLPNEQILDIAATSTTLYVLLSGGRLYTMQS